MSSWPSSLPDRHSKPYVRSRKLSHKPGLKGRNVFDAGNVKRPIRRCDRAKGRSRTSLSGRSLAIAYPRDQMPRQSLRSHDFPESAGTTARLLSRMFSGMGQHHFHRDSLVPLFHPACIHRTTTRSRLPKCSQSLQLSTVSWLRCRGAVLSTGGFLPAIGAAEPPARRLVCWKV